MARFPQFYPAVKSIIEPEQYSAGQIIGSRPLGVVVHDTADRDLVRVRRSLKEQGLGYHLLIDRDGKVIQLCYFDRRANHAGNADWKKYSPNRWFASVSLASWGKLEKVKGPDGPSFQAWNKSVLDPAEVVYRVGADGKKSYWDAATPAQETALLEVLRWFVAMGVDAENVCGHDECALPKGRKSDPGGVLSRPMAAWRAAAADAAK